MGEAAELCKTFVPILPPLVDMPNDDVSPVDIGTDAASQLHIIEMDNAHSTLAFTNKFIS